MKIKESQMLENFAKAITELPPAEFVEEYNRSFGTDLVVGEVEFDGGILKFEPANVD